MATADSHETCVRLLCDVNEVCALLGIKRTMLFRLMSSGEIRSCKVGRLRKVARVDVEAFVQRLRAAGDAGHFGSA